MTHSISSRSSAIGTPLCAWCFPSVAGARAASPSCPAPKKRPPRICGVLPQSRGGVSPRWHRYLTGNTHAATKPRLTVTRAINRTTKLLQALRDALGMNRIVSTAVGAGDYFPENTEMDKVAEIVDYVQLMTYDMRNGFHASGRPPRLPSVPAAAIRAIRTRATSSSCSTMPDVPYNKLVVGAAFYCRHYTGAANVNNGLLREASAVCTARTTTVSLRSSAASITTRNIGTRDA